MRLLISWILLIFCSSVMYGANLQQLINDAIRNKQRELKLVPAIYRLSETLEIKRAKNLTIDGTGSTILFTRPKMYGMHLIKNVNLTLKGFTIDFETLPFTQGTIVKTGKEYITIRLHKGYPVPDMKSYRLKFAVHAFDGKTREWKARGHNSMAKSFKITALGEIRIKLKPHAGYLTDSTKPVLKPGDFIVVNLRATNGISVIDCDNFTMDGVTIHTFAGINILGRGGNGPHTFKHVRIVPGPKPEGADQKRLISSCADGINYSGLRGRLIVENCDFSRMADDSINFYGVSSKVLKVIDDKTFIASVFGRGNEYLKLNDPLAFYSSTDLAPVGKVRITSFKTLVRSKKQALAYIRDAGFKVLAQSKFVIVEIAIDQSLKLKPGMHVNLEAFTREGALIRNNYFHHHRARGIRLQVSNTVIENNRFENIMHAGITLGPEGEAEKLSPFQADWLENIMIRHNIFKNIGRGYTIANDRSKGPGAIATEVTKFREIKPGYAGFKNISIIDNVINGCSVAGIYLVSVDGLTITGNKISNTNQLKVGSEINMPPDKPISLYYCRNVTQYDNSVSVGN